MSPWEPGPHLLGNLGTLTTFTWKTWEPCRELWRNLEGTFWEPWGNLEEPYLGTFTWEPGNLYLGTWNLDLGTWEPYLGTFTWNLGTLGEWVLELLRSAPKPLLWLKTPKHSAVGEKWRDQKQARQKGPVILRESTFGSFWKYICYAQGSKTGPSAFWIWCLPGGCLTPHLNHSRRVVGIIFFPSNAIWLSSGRLSSRKDNCILQIHRIGAVATSVMRTMCIQKRTDLDQYTIHWLSPCRTKKATKQTPKTSFSLISFATTRSALVFGVRVWRTCLPA